MAVPRSMGWLVVTGAVVLTLVGLSMFALDRPNVVWERGAAHCPHCRTPVKAFGRRCPTCREEFDWLPTDDETSLACARCLTPGQDTWQRDRRRALTEEKATDRVAAALGLPPAAAAAYLKVMGRGQCGWCAGTGLDLGAPNAGEGTTCPVCLGDRRCVACGGDRRVIVGVEAAAVEADRYERLAATVRAKPMSADLARRELADAAGVFLRRHAGTAEVERLLLYTEADVAAPRTAVGAASERLAKVLEALAAD